MTTWTEKPVTQRSSESISYLDSMTMEFGNKSKPPTRVMPIQCESTRKNLERQAIRDPKADYLWAHRPFEKDPTVVNDKNEIVIPKCEASLENIEAAFKAQKTPKNTMGQSMKTSAGEERKEAAAYAFTYSLPSPMTRYEMNRLIVMQPYSSPPTPVVEEEDKSLAGRLMHKLWKLGLPVDRFIKKKLDVKVADSKP